MSLLASLNAALGDTEKPDETIPYWLATSLPNVNYVLSDDMTKAFPGGRLILISGPSSSGKTALATEAMVQAQRHLRVHGAEIAHGRRQRHQRVACTKAGEGEVHLPGEPDHGP